MFFFACRSKVTHEKSLVLGMCFGNRNRAQESNKLKAGRQILFFIFQHFGISDAQGTAIGIHELFNVEPIIDNLQRFDQNWEVIVIGMNKGFMTTCWKLCTMRKINSSSLVRSVVDVFFPASTRNNVWEMEQQNTCIALRGPPIEPATPAAASQILHETER